MQQTIVKLVDDLDGGEASETVRFGFDGTDYEIDLSDDNAQVMREALSKYVSAGRKAGGSSRRETATSKRSGGTQRDYDPAAVKAWAAARGKDVPARGRLPKALVEEFKAAGN